MIRLKLLGGVGLEGDDGPLTGPVAQRQRLATLAVLSASPKGTSREAVLALLWPDAEPDRARRSLSNVLYAVRTALGEDAVFGAGDELHLNRELVSVDTDEFEAAIASGDREHAVALYGGPFLEGFSIDSVEFEHWADGERSRYSAMYREALEVLAEEATADGRLRDAVEWWRQAAAHDRHNTRIATGLIKAMDAAGDTAGALRQAGIYRVLIESELGTEPDPVVEQLVAQIKRRLGASPSVPNSESSEPSLQPPLRAEPLVAESRRRQRPDWWNRRSVWAPTLLLVVGASVMLQFATPRLNQRRVVVAVFENQTDDPSFDRLGRIASDWITRGLQESALIEVVPPEAALALQRTSELTSGPPEQTMTVDELAKATGAGTVVSGAFYLLGDSLQFQARVIDARRQRLLLAVDPVAGPRAAPMTIVDALREEVISVLASVFDTHLALYVSVSVPPPTFDAYQEFMVAEELFDQGTRTGQTRYHQDAGRSYRHSIQLDSTFAAALVRAAMAYGNLGQLAVTDSLVQKANRQRERLTPLGQDQLDLLRARLDGDRMEALRVSRRLPSADRAIHALSNNRPREAIEALEGYGPFSPLYWQWMTDAHHRLGEYRQEARLARRARKDDQSQIVYVMYEIRALAALGSVDELEALLDESENLPPQPGWPPGRVMGIAAAELRGHGHREASFDAAERAVAWYKARVARDSVDSPYRFPLAWAYYLNEDWDAASGLFHELAQELPGNINVQGYLGVLAARRGDLAEANRISSAIEGAADAYDFGRDRYWQACIAALLGEQDHAMDLLRDAYGAGREFTLDLHTDIDLEPLHNYPPFENFLRPKG